MAGPARRRSRQPQDAKTATATWIPTWRYPNGYVRFYNCGAAVDDRMEPPVPISTKAPTYRIRRDGTFDVPKGWNP